MDPFFDTFNWYNQPNPFRPHFSQNTRTNVATQPIKRPENPKSVQQITVQFSGSKSVNRSVFASKIQNVFRGFLVRKGVKKIIDIKKQVDLIDETLSKHEIGDLVRKDEKERLRMNESLMTLLLKLDSIRGADFGVRECRKKVIRKVIALQERIDAIVVINLSDNEEKVEKESIVDVGVDSELTMVETDSVGFVEKDGNNDIGEWIEVGDGKEEMGRGCDYRKRNNELMERMMEDNVKMMDMMTQLFESNEKQMQMLSALSNRVEMLEKTLICEKRRKKQKKKVGSLGDERMID